MNYHIIPQDKFFNAYVEDIYKIGEEANSIIFVRGNADEYKVFQTTRPVEYLGYDERHILERLKMIKAEDKLFVSWYDTFIADIIIKSAIKCKVYAYLMGGDFYNDPPEYHDFWLYDRKTRYYIRRNQRQHGVLAYPLRSMYKLPFYLYDSYKHSKLIKERYRHKMDTLHRLDYIVTPSYNAAEIDFIKKLYPKCHAQHAFGGFDQNVDITKGIEYEYIDKKGKPLTILLGNSGDPTNNHVDALKFLKSGRLADSKVFCPLSYGNNAYIDFVEKNFSTKIGSRFVALKSFMERGEYVRFLSNIDIFVFNHNRQQAFGNIITALSLGKPVFMKKQSIVFSVLMDIGIRHIYDIKELNRADLDEIRILSYRDRNETYQKISDVLSDRTRRTELRALLC